MKAKWIILIVILMTAICIPTFAAVRVGAVEELPEAEDVGLPDDGYYRIEKFDGNLGFTVSWSSKSLTTDEFKSWFCVAQYQFECVDGYTVKPPPVGRYCEKIGNQKLSCNLEIHGIQKAGDYQIIRWRETQFQRCYAYVGKLGNCPPVCPECLP